MGRYTARHRRNQWFEVSLGEFRALRHDRPHHARGVPRALRRALPVEGLARRRARQRRDAQRAHRRRLRQPLRRRVEPQPARRRATSSARSSASGGSSPRAATTSCTCTRPSRRSSPATRCATAPPGRAARRHLHGPRLPLLRGRLGGRNFAYSRMERLAAPWTDYLVTINAEDFAAARAMGGIATRARALHPRHRRRHGALRARGGHRRRGRSCSRTARHRR